MERPSKSSLDDPAGRALAWARYWRMMRWMAAVTTMVIALALAYLGESGPLRLNMVIATVLGIGLTMLVGTGLMLLVFLSNGTGHDREVQSRLEDRGW